MTILSFVLKYRLRWQELEALLDLLDTRSPQSRQRAFIQDLSAHYRATVADLAYAQTHFGGTTVLLFLHQLVGRAHNQIYRSRSLSQKELVHFLRREIPEAVRRHLSAVSWAALIFVAGIMLGLSAVQFDENAATMLLPANILDSIYSHRMWTGPIFSVVPAPVASTALLTNNISVALLAFAGGLTFGVVSFWILFLNGAMLGMAFKLCANYGLLGALLGFIASHGFLEISGIIVSGGAGLVVANALLRPGAHTRRDALHLQGRSAVRMTMAAIPALIVAGCIEAFISPTTLSPIAKVTIGGTLEGCFWLYLLGGSRRIRRG